MGYRSDVAYTIRFNRNGEHDDEDAVRAGFNIFLEQVMNGEDTKPCFESDIDPHYPNEGLQIDKNECAINFFWSSVKWYEEYPDVKCHEALIQTARDWVNEDNPHSQYLGYVFARVGEDVEDNTWDVGGNGDYNWVSVSRQVVCDWL